MTKDQDRRPVSHADTYASALRNTDRHYETSEQYSTDLQISDDEDTQTTARATQGEETSLRHPVDDPDELDHRKHVTAQFAEENRDDHADETTAEQFDSAILEFADRACTNAGIDVSTLPVEEEYVRAFFLDSVWQLHSIPAVRRHLTAHPATVERIGFDSVPSQTSFYRRREALPDVGWQANVEEASKRAVHAAWRLGVPVPNDIRTAWDLTQTTVVRGYPLSPATKREALRNWVRLLLRMVVSDLSFYRAGNTSYGIAQYIGMFAHSALQSIGITRGPDTAAWLYDPDTIPSGNAPLEQIKSDKLDVETLEDQFASAHASVLQLCANHGLFDDPVDLAYDTTDITWWGIPSDDTVGKRNPAKDATPDWVFAVLTTITNDARVCFGIKHVKSKDQHDAALDDLLRTATTHAPINHILADKEFYDGSIIDEFRKHVGPEWIIKAQEGEPVEELIRILPTDKPGIHRNLGVTSTTPTPNAFFIPNNFTGEEPLIDVRNVDLQQASDDQHTLADFGTADTHQKATEQRTLHNAQDAGCSATSHTAYLTDMDDDQTTAELIDSLYGDRWSIEAAIKNIKRDVHPVCESGNRKLRIYFANIAVLFFNWHALINRALSPRYALPLDVSHHELLTAIRDVALTEDIEGGE